MSSSGKKKIVYKWGKTRRTCVCCSPCLLYSPRSRKNIPERLQCWATDSPGMLLPVTSSRNHLRVVLSLVYRTVSCCALVFPVSLKQRDSHPGNIATTRRRSRTPSLSIPNRPAGSRHCRRRFQKTSQVSLVSFAFPRQKERISSIAIKVLKMTIFRYFHVFYYVCIFFIFLFS